MRIEKSVFNTFSIFIPMLYITQDIFLSVKYAIPVFSIIASGFILNDINDVDRDKINHPNRVLPKNNISINHAIILYYFFLTITLLTIKAFIPLSYVFVYLVYLVLATNYDYIIRSYPYLKNLYVSVAVVVHFSILYSITSVDIFILISLILNVLCKEIYMDIRDIEGDGNTFAKLAGIKKTGRINLAFQFSLVVLLSIFTYQFFTFIHCVILLFILITFMVNIFIWQRYNTLKLRTTMKIMVIQHIIIYGLII